MFAEYHFRFSEEHLLTSVLRYRQQLAWRRPFLGLKWVLASALFLLLLFAAYMGIPLLSGVFGAIIGVMLLGWPIDAWLMRRRFRKSPFRDENYQFVLSDDGAHVVSQNSDTRIAWAVFTKARQFSDGFLLFQGPGLFNWLPDSAAFTPACLAEAEQLIRAHVTDFRKL